MRATFFTALLAAMGFTPLSAQEQQDFIIISVHGDVRTWRLPTEWEARFEDGYLRLTDHNRMRMENVAAVRPKRSGPIPGYHEVELGFSALTGKRITQLFWVPDAYDTLEEVPIENGFHRIDERTIVRAGTVAGKP